MNKQERTEIRNLSSDEMEDVSGAQKFQVGPVKIKILEGYMLFSISVDGIGAFCIDTQGAWTA